MFKAVPVGHTNNWQNFGYVVQWWLFAAMALFGYGWVARREARRAAGLDAEPRPAGPGGRADAQRVRLILPGQPVTRPAWMARTASMVSASAADLSSR